MQTLTKKPWMSKAVVGAAVVLLSTGLNLFGYQIDDVGMVDDCLKAIGGALALWGRFSAIKKVSWK